MITYLQAQQQIAKVANRLAIETIPLKKALGRVIAEDIVYDINMPPFDKSAMDGYACARKDLSLNLVLVETIHAGKQPEKKLQKGECSKIMTGAPVPIGADMVFKQEDAIVNSDETITCSDINAKGNICFCGEDVTKGSVVLSKNTLIEAKQTPLLAGAGYAKLKVYKQPQIKIITSGTELVEPSEKPLAHQIRNSNATQIQAQLEALKLPYEYLGVIKDDETNLKESMRSAFNKSDVLIMSGGVSVGDFDLIPKIIEELGFSIELNKTAIQPGKPMVFAHKEGKYFFGLSGNPVASFIQFELYAKPFLYALQGLNYKPLLFNLPLANHFKRKNAGRHLFTPAIINSDNQVEPILFNGSAHINALSNASCFIEVPIGTSELESGTMVQVRPF